jgi:hypothetical protein
MRAGNPVKYFQDGKECFGRLVYLTSNLWRIDNPETLIYLQEDQFEVLSNFSRNDDVIIIKGELKGKICKLINFDVVYNKIIWKIILEDNVEKHVFDDCISLKIFNKNDIVCVKDIFSSYNKCTGIINDYVNGRWKVIFSDNSSIWLKSCFLIKVNHIDFNNLIEETKEIRWEL